MKSRAILTTHSRNIMQSLNDAKERGSATETCGSVKHIGNYKQECFSALCRS